MSGDVLAESIKRLSQINCSEEQMAAFAGITIDELNAKYFAEIALGKREPLLEMESEIRRLASFFAGDEEIANYLRMDLSLLRRKYGIVIDEGRSIGKVWIAKEQFKQASSGNTEMLKYLGRQHLGQS